MAVVYTDPEGQKNTIAANVRGITDRIDEIIQREALTNGMMVDSAFVQATQNAGEVRIADFVVSGMGNYDRQLGYPRGASTVTFVPYKLHYDRGIHIDVDKRDEQESGNVATIAAIAAFQTRHHVIPEIDATRIAKVAQEVESKYATNYVSTALTPANILNELDNAISAIFDTTGIDSGLQIYMNNKLRGVLNQTTQVTRTKDIAGSSRNINLATKELDGMPITFMPGNRMYSSIDLLNVDGTDNGGYAKSADASDINFIIAAPGAINAITAINRPKFISAEVNQEKDADAYMNRVFHDVIVSNASARSIYVSVGA